MSRLSVGLLVIATGPYIDFADQLVRDAEQHLAGSDVVLNIFTDATPNRARRLRRSTELDVNLLPVPALRWPEASLYRYELFNRAATDLHGDALVYLDADLRIVKPFTAMIRPREWPNQMAAVRHPGYYRRGLRGPRGTWETRRESVARVSPLRRARYVCGGVWMGSRESVLGVSTELAARVRTDAANDVMATWHDESHWNWWVGHHRVRLLNPSFCHVPTYPWLSELDPIIVAVDKGDNFVREQTGSSAHAQILRRWTGPSQA